MSREDSHKCIDNCIYATEISKRTGIFKCIGHSYISMREIEAEIYNCKDYKPI